MGGICLFPWWSCLLDFPAHLRIHLLPCIWYIRAWRHYSRIGRGHPLQWIQNIQSMPISSRRPGWETAPQPSQNCFSRETIWHPTYRPILGIREDPWGSMYHSCCYCLLSANLHSDHNFGSGTFRKGFVSYNHRDPDITSVWSNPYLNSHALYIIVPMRSESPKPLHLGTCHNCNPGPRQAWFNGGSSKRKPRTLAWKEYSRQAIDWYVWTAWMTCCIIQHFLAFYICLSCWLEILWVNHFLVMQSLIQFLQTGDLKGMTPAVAQTHSQSKP